jgi:nucleotide-binding universal stress UspA family protein
MLKAVHQSVRAEPVTEPRVVAAVDGSAPARRALQWAGFMAGTIGAAVDAVAVWNVSPAMAESWVDSWAPDDDKAAELHTIVGEVLGPEPVIPVRETVRCGATADEIVQASRGARLLVLGRRDRTGLGRLRPGSISTWCVARARCPVLTIRADTPPPPVA